jgi:NADH-quinone oxidoreductase subunit L
MDQLIVLSLIALGLPLVAFVLVIFNQRSLNERAHLISIPAIAFSLVLSLYVAWMKLKFAPGSSLEWSFDWIRFGSVPGFGPLTIVMGALVDNVTVILMVVVTGVSFLVHLFSIEYMKQDARYARYFAYLGFFTTAMLGIVLANNLLGLFIFWELVGFASYVLIGHWYERPAPQYAAKKAFIANRVGDAVMWVGILLLFAQFHTFNYRELFAFINHGLPITFSFLGFSPETTLTIAGLLLFAGAIAKSAQFPLHVWLPDAMEGPTPVSALIHAATMVAAGVYLMARIFPMLTGDAMLVVACTGAFTALLAASIAITQNDIKRVLAYSTISQLGLMIMSIGAGAVAAAMFHLVTHAAFKACLFLCAGSVIHATHRAMHVANDHEFDDRDMWNMGGLLKRMPVTGWAFIVATLAVTGLPLMAGLMSKDEILAGTEAYGRLAGNVQFAGALPIVGLAVTLLTAFYMWRQVFLVFFGIPAKRDLHERIRESPLVMTVPVVLLAVFSLWIWYGPNPVNPESGWFLKKWIKTPAQVIPPQTAPMFVGVKSLEQVPAEPKLNTSEGFGYSVAPIAPPPIILPMPHQLALETERQSVAPMITLVAMAMSISGLIVAWLLYLFRPGVPSRIAKWSGPLYRLSLRGWYVDEMYEYAVVGTFLFTARVVVWADDHLVDGLVNGTGRATVMGARLVGWFDRYVVDGIVTLVGATVQFLGLMSRSLQTGRIQTYLAWVVASVVMLFIVVRYVFLAAP